MGTSKSFEKRYNKLKECPIYHKHAMNVIYRLSTGDLKFDNKKVEKLKSFETVWKVNSERARVY